MKTSFTHFLLLFSVSFLACGEGVIVIDDSTYEPKIVIEGYLSPFKPVENIRLMRNFPINTTFDRDEIILREAEAAITDESTGKVYALEFDAESGSYRYAGDDLVIAPEHSYTLNVSATIDGRRLSAWSTTTTPATGFRIDLERSRLGSLPYHARSATGELEFFQLAFQRSPGIDFYVLSSRALDASEDSFIFNNTFFSPDSEFVAENLEDLQFNVTWLQGLKPLPFNSPTIFNVGWYMFFFYGRHELTLYAGDQNYKDFFLTYNQVQELDGNFHEPVFHIKGDGIGVFGSVIAETVLVEVTR